MSSTKINGNTCRGPVAIPVQWDMRQRALATFLLLVAGCPAQEPLRDVVVELGQHDLALDRQPVVELPTGRDLPGVVLRLDTPAQGQLLVVGRPVELKGWTACANATLSFVADGKYPFGTLQQQSGPFSLTYAFTSPGLSRTIEVSVLGDQGCSAKVSRTVVIQAALAHKVESLQDSQGCTFELHSVTVPLADPSLELSAVGSGTARTIKQHALDQAQHMPFALINGGYFAAASGPLSYAKGHLGYESPSGNVKGPRACLVYDRSKRAARVVISFGRQPAGSGWGPGLFTADSDVVCAGPRLLDAGKDVFWTQYAAEHFESSGIGPTSATPRSALCLQADGSLMLVMAQSPSKKACGLDLPALTALLLARGCTDAINLDGGGSAALWAFGVYQPGTEDRAVYQALMVYQP